MTIRWHHTRDKSKRKLHVWANTGCKNTSLQSDCKYQTTVQEECRCEATRDTHVYRVTANIRQLHRKSAGVRRQGIHKCTE